MLRNISKLLYAKNFAPPKICTNSARKISYSTNYFNQQSFNKNQITIEEMVEHLERENAKDIVVIEVPKEQCYVDYFILVSGFSERHLDGMAELTNKFYKSRKHPGQKFALIEGKDTSEDWKSLDIGNMVIHFMLPETREKYELEKLWLLGYEHDDLIKQKPSFEEIANSMAFGGINLMNKESVSSLDDSDFFDQYAVEKDTLFDDDIELQNIFEDNPLQETGLPGESREQSMFFNDDIELKSIFKDNPSPEFRLPGESRENSQTDNPPNETDDYVA